MEPRSNRAPIRKCLRGTVLKCLNMLVLGVNHLFRFLESSPIQSM